MGSFGQLVVCMTAVLSAAGGALVMAAGERPRLAQAGEKLLHAAAMAGAVSLLVLIFLLLAHDYRVAYVRDYADRTMSTAYLTMAVWGGQQGSLLLWAVLQTWFTSATALWVGGTLKHLKPIALGFLASLQVFFLLLVLFHSNPFEALGTASTLGIGMNPLLRNPYMAFHPPTLYLGFVGFSVPMAFALAALVDGRPIYEWMASLRPWILFAALGLLLAAGLLVSALVWLRRQPAQPPLIPVPQAAPAAPRVQGERPDTAPGALPTPRLSAPVLSTEERPSSTDKRKPGRTKRRRPSEAAPPPLPEGTAAPTPRPPENNRDLLDETAVFDTR